MTDKRKRLGDYAYILLAILTLAAPWWCGLLWIVGVIG